MRIRQAYVHRRAEPDDLDRRIDGDGRACRCQEYPGGHGNDHQHGNDEKNSFHFFVHLSTQSMKVLYQSALLAGFSTQWPSSGKISISDGTLRICSAVKSSSACE